MQIAANTEDQVLNSLNNIEARRHQTDVAFRSITALEIDARRQKTERLKVARILSSTKK